MAFDFPNEPSRTRVELAQRIAAYIVDSGLSWPAARARAVEECGGPRSLPGNSLPASDEIETAVRAHYALFAPEAHAQTLLTKRKLALAVLEHLQGFDAYLTGAVLNGAATEDSPICLEVFTDDVKSLLAVLMDEGFDLEALDPQASAFGRADESIGFVLPWQGNMEPCASTYLPLNWCAAIRRAAKRMIIKPNGKPKAASAPKISESSSKIVQIRNRRSSERMIFRFFDLFLSTMRYKLGQKDSPRCVKTSRN